MIHETCNCNIFDSKITIDIYGIRTRTQAYEEGKFKLHDNLKVTCYSKYKIYFKKSIQS